MKKNLFIALTFMLGSCNILDKQPLDTISDNTLWNDEALVTAYLYDLYANTPVFVNDASAVGWDPYSTDIVGMFYVNELSDECYYGWNFYNRPHIIKYKGGDLKVDGGLMEYWELPYKTIRKANDLIERMSMSTLSDDFRKQMIAEARFVRAFNYFAMVKRYGGVPLITQVQNMTDSEEVLYPKRNSEKEIYDFIIKEMEEVAPDLPEEIPTSQKGKPDKYTALALQSRAALYAGSIAKYGKVQLDGLLGIPADKANEYFEISYKASKKIIDDGKYALYQGDADKSVNFRNIFLVEDNSECIFVKKYDGIPNGGVVWDYDFSQCPKPHSWGAGQKNSPYLEMVESFERIDGTSGKLNYEELESKLWTLDELWGGRDPRFYATIWTEGTPWQGSTVGFYKGIITENGETIVDGSYKGVPACGSQTLGNQNFYTSFGVLKYLDESSNNVSREMAYSKTDYIVFRLGEIYLNLSEAAYELGKTEEALNALNVIRERAGMPDKTTIDMETIRAERKVELAFEGHRYWDLKRWRIAEEKLTGGNTGIKYELDYATRKYKITVIKNVEESYGDGSRSPLFLSHHYYFPITLSRTGANPNLVETPGY